jgi:3-isopropylmalate/(R)-2-methylmalate dehydratase large subunit
VRIARDWAREQRCRMSTTAMGICHVVVPQHGHIRPGMFCVGGDSHSPTGGAFGAYMFGIGATEMLGVVVTGEIWLRCRRRSHALERAPGRRRERQGHDAGHDRAASA